MIRLALLTLVALATCPACSAPLPPTLTTAESARPTLASILHDPTHAPSWYREIPNRPGIAIYGVGAAVAVNKSLVNHARIAARQAAVRQAKGRVRVSLQRAFERFSATIVDDTMMAQWTTGSLDRGAALDGAITDVAQTAVDDPRGLTTVYWLVHVWVHDVLRLVESDVRRRREQGLQPKAAPLFSLDELFVALRLEQQAAWGTAPLVDDEPTTALPPRWYAVTPREPQHAVFGVGAATSRGMPSPRRLNEDAQRRARTHLQELVRLTLAATLDTALHDAIGDPVPLDELARETASVAAVVAALAAGDAVEIDQAVRITDGAATSYCLVRVPIMQIARRLQAELLRAAPRLHLARLPDLDALCDYVGHAQSRLWG